MKTVNYSRNVALVAVASLCVASFAIGAHADESEAAAPVRTVRYSDLNLNTPMGAETLYRRIRSAAEQVCGNVSSRQVEESAAAKACVTKAVTASVHAVNSARLTSTYNEHVGVIQTSFNVASLR